MEWKGLHTDKCPTNNLNKEKEVNRREILEKKKAVQELIKAACAEKDPLSPFLGFRHYNRNGLSLYLESDCGNKLSSSVKQYVQSLLKVNMEGPYGSEWPREEKVKRGEMIAPEARYVFVHEVSNTCVSRMSSTSDREESVVIKEHVVAFVHYRFTIEEDVPVLYVYELQIEPRVQGRGLGKFLMQLIELVACKNCMGAVVLTVQKANSRALDFYIRKLRYSISTISPSRVGPLIGNEAGYEILCKAFTDEAKAILEDH